MTPAPNHLTPTPGDRATICGLRADSVPHGWIEAAPRHQYPHPMCPTCYVSLPGHYRKWNGAGLPPTHIAADDKFTVCGLRRPVHPIVSAEAAPRHTYPQAMCPECYRTLPEHYQRWNVTAEAVPAPVLAGQLDIFEVLREGAA